MAFSQGGWVGFHASFISAGLCFFLCWPLNPLLQTGLFQATGLWAFRRLNLVSLQESLMPTSVAMAGVSVEWSHSGDKACACTCVCVCGVCMPVYKYVWKGGGMGLRTEQQGLLTEEMQWKSCYCKSTSYSSQLNSLKFGKAVINIEQGKRRETKGQKGGQIQGGCIHLLPRGKHFVSVWSIWTRFPSRKVNHHIPCSIIGGMLESSQQQHMTLELLTSFGFLIHEPWLILVSTSQRYWEASTELCVWSTDIYWECKAGTTVLIWRISELE